MKMYSALNLTFVYNAQSHTNREQTVDDVFLGEKKGANRCSAVFCSLMISMQSCELSRHRNWDRQSSRCVLVSCDVR